MCNIHYIKNWCLFQCSYAYCYIKDILSNDNIEELDLVFGNWINNNNISKITNNVINFFSNNNYDSELYTEFENINNTDNINEINLKTTTTDENYINIELNKDNDTILYDDYVLIDKNNLN